MPYDLNEKKQESVFSKRIKAGKRRTYFFDVRETRGNDYFLTITESKKRFDDNGYERHKVFIYKEDFNKFTKALIESVDYVKTELMPDFDFDAFNHEYPENGETIFSEDVEVVAENKQEEVIITSAEEPKENNNSSMDNNIEHVDKW